PDEDGGASPRPAAGFADIHAGRATPSRSAPPSRRSRSNYEPAAQRTKPPLTRPISAQSDLHRYRELRKWSGGNVRPNRLTRGSLTGTPRTPLTRRATFDAS